MKNDRWKIFIAFACVYVIWGSTYLGIRIAIETLPPFFMASLRFLVCGLLLFVWRKAAGDPLPARADWFRNALCGLLILFGGVAFVGWSEQFLSSSLAAIIVTAVPFWFILFDKKQWAYYFGQRSILTGLILGFLGVGILVIFSPSTTSTATKTQQLLGVLVIMAGGVTWTIGSLYSKYRLKHQATLMNAAMQFLTAGLFSLLVSGLAGEWKHISLPSVSLRSWLALAYLITAGSLVAFLAYLWLLKKMPAAQVSTYVYVNPVIAVLLGAWLAGEKIGWVQVIALGVILLGVLLVNLPKYSLGKAKMA